MKEDAAVNENNDWLKIFKECEKNVKGRVQVVRESPQPQEYLGVGAGGDQIKPVDLAAEDAIVEIVQKYQESFTLISEESGVRRFGDNPESCFLTVDPIDGTTNFVHGLPFYCCSIAVSSKPHTSQISITTYPTRQLRVKAHGEMEKR